MFYNQYPIMYIHDSTGIQSYLYTVDRVETPLLGETAFYLALKVQL